MSDQKDYFGESSKNNSTNSPDFKVRTPMSVGHVVVLALLLFVIASAGYFFYNKEKPSQTQQGPQQSSQLPQEVQTPQVQVPIQQQTPQSALETANQAVANAKATAQTQSAQLPTQQPQVAVDDNVIKFCVGPDSGAFIQIFNNLIKVSPNLKLQSIKTTGAVENQNLLYDGVCDFGFVQPDDKDMRLHKGGPDAESAKTLRTVVGVYDGEVNMIAKDPNLQKYSQFTSSTRFGLSGGAVATFQTVQNITGVKFSNVTNYATTEQQKLALKKGEIDVIIANGTYEQPWIKNIEPGMHMVKFDRFEALSGVMFTGPKGGYFGKRSPSYESLGNIPVDVLSTRIIIASTSETLKRSENEKMAQDIFCAVKKHVYTLQENKDGIFHDGWKRIAAMNDPGGVPWSGVKSSLCKK
jgi:hypothetical protein